MKPLNKILVPVNLKSSSYIYLQTAIELANKFNSKIILLYVFPKDTCDKTINDIINHSFSFVLDNIKSSSVNVDKKIVFGNVYEQINLIAKRENINLILTSDKVADKGELNNKNAISEKLLRKSQKSIWIVKDEYKNHPQKILCPVDYSKASARALNNAIQIAQVFNSKLCVINICEPLKHTYSRRFTIDYETENQKMITENKEKFVAFLKKFDFYNLDYQIKIIEGKPSCEIIHYIKENKVDITIMGTDKNNVQRYFIGSTTEDIINMLPCSIVITTQEYKIEKTTIALRPKEIQTVNTKSKKKLEEVIN